MGGVGRFLTALVVVFSAVVAVVAAPFTTTAAQAASSVFPVTGTYSLNDIVCTSASFCIAVGGDNYTLVQNGEEGGELNFPGSVYIDSLSCPKTADCFAVGYSVGANGVLTGVVIPFLYGEALSAVDVPGTLQLNSVACSSGSTSCVAVGEGYTPGPPASFYGVVVPLADGSPGTVQQISGVQNLNGVSCAAAKVCLAVGSTSSDAGALVPVASGVAAAATFPSGVTTLTTVACPTSGTCWTGGGGGEVLPVTSGSAGAVSEVSGVGEFLGATCPTTSQCYLVGTASGSGGVVLPIASGAIGALQTPLAAGSIYAMSCSGAIECIASGNQPLGNQSEGVIVDGAVATPAPMVTSVAFGGSGYSRTVTVTGTNFSPWAPEASPTNPVSCATGSPSYDYASGVLSFTDTTGSWSAGTPGSCIGIIVDSWSNTKVVFGFGAGYVWPLLAKGDAYQVDVVGTTFSGTANIAAAAAPTIKTVVVSGAGTSTPPTVSVTGANLGSRIPLSAGSPNCVGGDTSMNFNGEQLFLADESQGWTAGESGDCLGLSVSTFTPTEVVFSLGAFYPDVSTLQLGDTLEVGLLSATKTVTASATVPPVISNVTVTGSAANPTVTVTGTGLGADPPAADPSTPITCVSGDTSYTYPAGQLSFTDNTQGWTAGETGDCVGIVVKSWSATKAVLGMGADYANFPAVTTGDSVTVEVDGTSHTSAAGV